MSSVTKKRFTLQEYHRLTEIGFFKEDDQVELIQGEIIEMAAKYFYLISSILTIYRFLLPPALIHVGGV